MTGMQSNSASRYSGLTPARGTGRDMFFGRMDHERVAFDRMFRGRRFSDEECLALCRGEMLEVHGLERNGVRYSVVGCLRPSPYRTGQEDGAKPVMFRQDHVISYDPEYRFETRRVVMAWDADGNNAAEPSKPSLSENLFPDGFDSGLTPSEEAAIGKATEDMIENPLKLIMTYTELDTFVPSNNFSSLDAMFDYDGNEAYANPDNNVPVDSIPVQSGAGQVPVPTRFVSDGESDADAVSSSW